MKTLDEVIKEIEEFWVCPSNDEADEYCLLYDIYQDALQYLKEYRSDQIEWAANRKAWDEVQEDLVSARMKYIARLKELDIGKLNPPLTWDELREMEGKPVWIIESVIDPFDDDGMKRTGHWDIIRKAYPEQIAFYVQGMTNHKSWQGIGWQAYRKERG